MKEGNRFFRFVLIEEIQSNLSDQHGRSRTRQKSMSIPAQTTVIDEHNEVRQIRYVPSQKSIFVDEQDLGEQPVQRATQKPTFTMGQIIVPSSQQNLLKFLRSHPQNEANQHWGLPDQRSVFREFDAEAEARKNNSASIAKSNALRAVYTSDDIKRIAVARYLGMRTSPISIMEQDLFGYANDNPERFLELLGNEVVMRYSEIAEAVGLGVILENPTRITWPDGRQICPTPTGKDPKEHFSQVSFDSAMQSVWLEIKRQVAKIKKSPDSEIAVDPQSDIEVQLKSMPSDELFEVAKAKKIVNFKVPYWTFMEYKERGAEKFIDRLDSDENLKSLLITSIISGE